MYTYLIVKEKKRKTFAVRRQRGVSRPFVRHCRYCCRLMSYYDDYCYDDDYDDYSSEDEIFYHNYSVDYANQIIGGHHAISSCLPLMRRKHRRHSPRLVRVATLDQMPIATRHQIIPPLRSRPKYPDEEEISVPLPQVPPPPLPSLEATREELERRATRTTQPIFEVTRLFFHFKNFFLQFNFVATTQ